MPAPSFHRLAFESASAHPDTAAVLRYLIWLYEVAIPRVPRGSEFDPGVQGRELARLLAQRLLEFPA